MWRSYMLFEILWQYKKNFMAHEMGYLKNVTHNWRDAITYVKWILEKNVEWGLKSHNLLRILRSHQTLWLSTLCFVQRRRSFFLQWMKPHKWSDTITHTKWIIVKNVFLGLKSHNLKLLHILRSHQTLWSSTFALRNDAAAFFSTATIAAHYQFFLVFSQIFLKINIKMRICSISQWSQPPVVLRTFGFSA